MRARPRHGHRARRLEVTVSDGRGRPLTAGGLARWLERAAPASARGTVGIALVSDRRIHDLNRTFRGVDAPTDVLSFPPARESNRRELAQHIGDIAIGTGIARRQAKAEGHPLGTELRVLALHGLLHLLGYDHERDRGSMRRLENRLRIRAGLPAGLIARVRRPSRRR